MSLKEENYAPMRGIVTDPETPKQQHPPNHNKGDSTGIAFVNE